VRTFEIVLLIHAHQPVGNFDDVFERAYARCYLPFLEVLARHPSIRMGLHYSGPLLEWIERAHPVYFDRLRALAGSGQVEMVGGGFYEPILVAIPPEDRREQITRLADYIEKHFGARPRGAWVAERVWEPQIPSSLEPAGVEYTLVDDNHFLGAGCELEQLYGCYVSEDRVIDSVSPGPVLLRGCRRGCGLPNHLEMLPMPCAPARGVDFPTAPEGDGTAWLPPPLSTSAICRLSCWRATESNFAFERGEPQNGHL
jgi:hypothetical protein